MRILNKPIIFFLFLTGMCLWGRLIYSNTFNVPFVFDDEAFILHNPTIRNFSDGALWQDLNYQKRFVAFFSFALNYRLHGFNVVGYHLVNLAIHLFTSLCVVWLVRLLLGTPRLREEKIAAHKNILALLSGWLFISHPIQTEAVTYISQRFESLATLFYVFSVCCYIKGRMLGGSSQKRFGFFFVSAVSMILGMLTKEIVFTLPLVLILFEGVFWGTAVYPQSKGGNPPTQKVYWIWLGSIFLVSLLFFSKFVLDIPTILNQHNDVGITSGKYFLTQLRVIIKYLRLLFLPLGQNLDYDFPLSLGLFNGPTLGSLLCLLALLFTGFKLTRRYTLVGFGILWFFLTLSITSSIVPILDVIFEHRLYLPSVGFVIAFCAGLFYLIRNVRVFVLCLGGIILIFSFLTYQRNAVWADDVTLWEDVVRKSPLKSRPYVNLGKAYRRRGDPQRAIAYYLEALRLKGGNDRMKAQVYVNLGAAYSDLHKYQDEISCCLRAIDLDPQNPQAYSNLAYAYALTNNYEKALVYGKEAVKISPQFDEGLNNLGVVYGNMGQYENAAELFEQTLKVNPYFEKARINLRLVRDLMDKKRFLNGRY